MMSQLRIAVDGRSLQGERTGIGTYIFNLLEQLLLLYPATSILLITDRRLPPIVWRDRERVQVVAAAIPWSNNFRLLSGISGRWLNLRARRKPDLSRSTYPR